MKKLLLNIIIFYLLTCTLHSTEWIVSDQLDSNNNGNDWYLIANYDSLNCIMVGSDFNGIPRVIISEDAGKTWKYISNVAISEYMKDTTLKFTKPNAVYYDKDKIFIITWDNNEKQAYFLISFNKGESWELKKTDIYGTIKFQKNEGVLFGGDKIFYTNDNGISWEEHDISIPEAYGVAEMVRFNSLDEFSILMVSQTNKKAWLCKTINRGNDWEIDAIPYYCRYMSFKFFDDNIGWVIGSYENGIGDTRNDVILKTIDGGKSWQKVADSAFKDDIVIPAGVYDVDVISKDEAIVVGSTTKALYTKDGGDTWEILSKGVNDYGKLLFKAVKFIAPKTIIAGGWENFVARYELNEEVSVEDNQKINEGIIIYPIPTMDFIYFKSNNTTGKIEIFSALGIKVLETEYKDRIDVSGLSAGVYFVKFADKVIQFVKL